MKDESELTTTQPTVEPVNVPGRNEMPVENRAGADTATGNSTYLSWGARSDVGLVRSGNEDSFLVRSPLFVVCDGMGGHAAGEVASKIAVDTIGENAPETADDIALGAAVEEANRAVLDGARTGKGKPGMGCTATCVYIEKNKMAVAHVGDSRVYLLHAGKLVRVTHDHSYVEELVDAGEITADEARVHPSRSIITRALGSDPDMYADHFTLDVSTGDRIIVCSDGLSSMVPDKNIELLAVSSATPQAAANSLVSAALTAGGHDNVTVVVVDVVEDGLAEVHRERRRRNIMSWAGIVAAAIVVVGIVMGVMVHNSWYLGDNNGTVGVFRGVNGSILGVPLNTLADTSSVEVTDLPEATQHQLNEGIQVKSEDDAQNTVEQYRDQIDAEKTKAAIAASESKANPSDVQPQNGTTPAPAEATPNEEQSGDAGTETGDALPAQAAATGEKQAKQIDQQGKAQADDAKNSGSVENPATTQAPDAPAEAKGAGD